MHVMQHQIKIILKCGLEKKHATTALLPGSNYIPISLYRNKLFYARTELVKHEHEWLVKLEAYLNEDLIVFCT